MHECGREEILHPNMAAISDKRQWCDAGITLWDIPLPALQVAAFV